MFFLVKAANITILNTTQDERALIYLPVPAPFGPHIRITPPHFTNVADIENPSSDLSRLVHLLKQLEIYIWLVGPASQYTKEHGVRWLTARKAEYEQVIWDMEFIVAASDPLAGRNKFVSNSSVRFIRERRDDGTDVLLGNIMICQSVFREVKDGDERERKVRENAERSVGDPNTTHSFG
ncbi:hypothetical protein FRB99_008963, partial [Tulasnella sp. 403]